ncbi:hypothetical protein NL676_039477 [Syzygium grande]|nr:hypothetical protein NL676_039477 [Syzygium grande]
MVGVQSTGAVKAGTAVVLILNSKVQYCVDHPEEICRLAKAKAQVSEVKRVTMEDMEKVLDRGEEFEPLVDKKENLPSPVSNLLPAQDFRQQGNEMRRKLWLHNVKVKLIVLGMVVALILIIVLSICHGFMC